MRTSIIFIVVLLCFSFVHAQNPYIKPIKILFIIKSDTGITKTNHLFVDTKDVADLYLPSRDEALKSLGPTQEDQVFYITLKKDVKLLTLSKLLANKKLDVGYNNIPVYIDGEAITNPDDILSTETGLRNLYRTSKRIDIITKLGAFKKITGTRN